MKEEEKKKAAVGIISIYTYKPDWLKGLGVWFGSVVKLPDNFSDVGGGLRLQFDGRWMRHRFWAVCCNCWGFGGFY